MIWIAFIWLIVFAACLTLTTVVRREGCFLRATLPLAAKYVGVGFGPWTLRAGLLWLAAAIVSLVTIESRAARSTFRSDPDYLIDAWETEDGLPENSATAMVQTFDGYLWFGTFRGLVRFDGVKFTVFNSGNTPQLPSDGIVNLHLDRTRRLWISTAKGLVVREGQQWRTLGTNEGWAGDYVRSFAERANGDLLLTTFDGQVMEYVNGRLAQLPAPPGEPRHGYFAHADEAGQWWVVQNRFVGRWDGHRWVEAVRLNEPIADAVVGGTAPDGSLLLVLRHELRRYRRGVEAPRVPLDQLGGGIWSVSEDSRGDVWIASYDKGLFRVQPDGRFQLWTTTNGLSYNSTRFVFEDRERNLWVGTSGGGLMRFKQRRFQMFSVESGLSERVVTSVWPDVSGGLWIASYGKGLFHLAPTGIRNVPLPDRKSSTIYAQSVLHDRTGRTWVGTLGEGVWLFDSQGARRIPPTMTGGRTISALFEDSRGRVWVGGDQGLAVFEAGAFRVVAPEKASRIGGVVSFAEDRDGGLWVSNLAAVFRFGPEGLVELREGAESLRDIACLKADADGGLWLGSRHAGLRHWHAGHWTSIGPQAGLPVSAVHGILEDGHGFFWLSSNRGIARVSRNQLLAVVDGKAARVQGQLFDLSDGLASIECPSGSQPACARDPQGRLWFATSKGVAMIDPDEFRPNTNRPPVQIEEVVYRRPAPKARREPAGDSTVRRFKRSTAQDEIEVRLAAPFNQPLHLPAGSRQIEIHYTALSLSAPEKVRFQTQIEGTGHDWDEPHDRRITRYYEWPPGEYTFRVRAANNDGVWNETGASLAFTVLPHYWQMWWFRLGGALLLISLGGATVWRAARTRVRRAMERVQAAHQIRELAGRLINAQEDERGRIARELHDDFSQRLALLSVEMELLGSAASGPQHQSAPRLDEMAARVKELSTEVHRLAYELHPAKLDQLGLVATARSLCRDLSRPSGVRIEFERGGFPREIPAGVALCLYRIIQESLQNVIRHSGATEARVELAAERDSVYLVVSDSGSGFEVDRARREGGLGLASMEERVRLLQGKFSVESGAGRGTRVKVSLPLPNLGPVG